MRRNLFRKSHRNTYRNVAIARTATPARSKLDTWRSLISIGGTLLSLFTSNGGPELIRAIGAALGWGC
jgi:hypothetical protein